MSARRLGWRLLGPQDRAAEQNRAVLNAAGVLAINLIAPPGAGKAALIRRTVGALGGAARVGVVSTTLDRGDHDAAVTIEVAHGGAPHLSPVMLAPALANLDQLKIDFLVIKNVADFVCPATYRLGSHLNVRITTVLDQEERPHALPQLFEGLDALIVNKLDRLRETHFDIQRFRQGLDLLNPNIVLLPLSCVTGEGIGRWVDWLMRRRSLQFYLPHPPDARGHYQDV